MAEPQQELKLSKKEREVLERRKRLWEMIQKKSVTTQEFYATFMESSYR